LVRSFTQSERSATAPRWRSRRLIFLLLPVAFAALLVFVGLRLLAERGAPPRDLSATEAVDLACFQGWDVGGTPAYVPHPQAVFVAELSPRDVRSYLQQMHLAADWPSTALGELLSRTLVVVAHGTVTDGPREDATPRAEGLILVVDADGTIRYVDVGPPWDTAVPPGARTVPAPDAPRLGDVSRARARLELGGKPLVELASPPGGLALRKIAINPERLPVDPTGTSYPVRTVTLSYADGTGRPRLWITQPTAAGEPRILGRPVPLAALRGGVTPYAWYAGTWEVVGYAWPRDGRVLFLTAEPGPDLPVEEITRTVLALTTTTTPTAASL
jgi:hypothetical protein